MYFQWRIWKLHAILASARSWLLGRLKTLRDLVWSSRSLHQFTSVHISLHDSRVFREVASVDQRILGFCSFRELGDSAFRLGVFSANFNPSVVDERIRNLSNDTFAHWSATGAFYNLRRSRFEDANIFRTLVSCRTMHVYLFFRDTSVSRKHGGP